MKTTIYSLSELKEFGINILTGESCALSRRLLCDLTKEGKDLVTKALGVEDVILSPNWNGRDAVGSILLERETLQTCGILALLNNSEVLEVWVNEVGHIHGLNQELLDSYFENKVILDMDGWRKYKTFKRIGSENCGDRNVHQMSGRSS